ncbi:aminotransferase class I/II-fold pyridoxal phosphate-dependent enzyme [Actinomadura sp. BRA 177]|uniref:aminotransferase class I/II-fold pyridoxal phosphate-dependent enzyme n=1 Tax=Actinomadura sp. BRA 177 TaxID=2745202 RepID=UPI001595FA53|nr:aminotransferase class I/II-fold pyridoxal phosphate-dependent enzyme [Actinomadura sp. BRA 177]NVI88992.1 aminotransferase class I/II-fold pyridoxal phosphate-dependent enzyme [Actinomadura sp. BRA 177]
MTDLAHSAPAPARRQVLEIIASNTLYDVAQLRPESHFEGELGVDAAVLEAIVGDVRDRFGPRVRLPGEPATPQDLIDAVERALAAGAPGDDAGLPEAVMAAAMRHTHYRRDQLDLDAELEAELGIDSVVLASIIGDAAEELGLPDGLAAEITVPNLRALIGELRARTGAPEPPPDELDPEELAVGELDPVRPAPSTSWDGRSMRDFMDDRDPDLFAKARGFTSYLRGREAEHLYWYGMPLRSRCANRARIHDELTGRTREFLMFASNNYLGLANHPRVVDAICEATRSYGATNTGCRIIGGTNHLHKELERRLAAFKRRPACIVYPGGYSANLGAVSALVKSHDALIVDKLNHMSIVDGCKLSGGVRKIYGHNDMRALERVLERCEGQVRGGKLIVTDGVFSMHGDVCDLPEIVRLARRYGARVMVDDAHATGVLGERGSGTAEHFGLKDEVDLELGTMSKALAGMGGFVAGEEEVVEYLRFYSNSYVFAATIPAGVAAGLIAAIDVLEEEPERLAALWSNIRRLRADLADAGFDLEDTQSAILPIVIGDERRALEMGRAVRARGLFCQTVVFPGVPLGDARLRVSVTSEHTPEDLALAAQIFVDAARETGVLPGGGREAGR